MIWSDWRACSVVRLSSCRQNRQKELPAPESATPEGRKFGAAANISSKSSGYSGQIPTHTIHIASAQQNSRTSRSSNASQTVESHLQAGQADTSREQRVP